MLIMRSIGTVFHERLLIFVQTEWFDDGFGWSDTKLFLYGHILMLLNKVEWEMCRDWYVLYKQPLVKQSIEDLEYDKKNYSHSE